EGRAHLLRRRLLKAASLAVLSVKLAEQSPGAAQVARGKAFVKPGVDGGEKVTCHLPLALVTQKPCHTHGRAQFPRFCLLCSGKRQRTSKIGLCFRCVPLWRLECDFTRHAIGLGLAPSLPGCLHRCHRLANTVPRFVELIRICM